MTEQLTREQVLEMDPGEELDDLIVRKVMRWDAKSKLCGEEYEDYWHDGNRYTCECALFNPSKDISAAWEVLSRFPVSTMERVEVIEGRTTVHITLWPSADTENKYSATASANTFELAVCRASLLAVMGL